MNNDRAQVTAAAEAIRRREDGQKRITKIVVPLFGLVMIGAEVLAGCSSVQTTAAETAVMVMSALFYLMSYSSLINATWTIGMIPQAGIGAYFFVLAALFPWLAQCESIAVRVLFGLLFAAAGTVVLFVLCVLAVMLVGSISPAHRGEYTLMVLGCKLKNGRPGRMLRRRLRKAVSELVKHPEIKCVVSGGRAPDQPCAEAEAMADSLVEMGIQRERIIVEKLSSTTYENFLFTGEILRRAGVPARVGVVTDRFHQFRSGRIARSADMDSFPISCSTVWYLSVQFWMRDVLCIAERIIRGHW